MKQIMEDMDCRKQEKLKRKAERRSLENCCKSIQGLKTQEGKKLTFDVYIENKSHTISNIKSNGYNPKSHQHGDLRLLSTTLEQIEYKEEYKYILKSEEISGFDNKLIDKNIASQSPNPTFMS